MRWPFAELLGMRAKSIGEGRARYELEVEAKHLNPNGPCTAASSTAWPTRQWGPLSSASSTPAELCVTLEIKLTAAAVETTRVRLGALVYCVACRNPGLHAKSLTKHGGPRGDERSGWLRGTPKDTLAMLTAFRDAGCARVNLAFREGPYDWEALHAFAEQVLPAFGARRAE